MSRRRPGGLAVTTALAALALPASASAHGIGGRSDLPVPGWLFSWAASAVLVLSFLALGALWHRPQLDRDEARPLFRIPPGAEALCSLLGVALLAGLVYAGFEGSQTPTTNVVPTFVYVVFWVLVGPVSAVLGDVFRAFNPWRAVARAAGWAAARAGASLPAPMAYPARLGRWPAVVSIVAFGWLELVAINRDDPSLIAALALAYAALQLIGMSLYGIEVWTERGDGFSAYFALFARLSPLTVRDGRVAVRRPLAGLASLSAIPGTVALLCTAIGITAFDGAEEGELWSELATTAHGWVSDLGLSATTASQIVATFGLLGSIALVYGFFRAGVAGIRTVAPRLATDELAGRFAGSLAPIALAYLVAHYFSLAFFQGQAMAYLVSDPLGRGSDLLGTANVAIDYGAISMRAIWYIQVGALVAGHVGGLAVAHDRALSLFGSTREASRSQYWMLAVMVGFTSLGLWLLSSANA